jgi:hypothetical protein
MNISARSISFGPSGFSVGRDPSRRSGNNGHCEVGRVAEAAGLPFNVHDLAVEPFGHAVGDRVLDEAEHAGEVTLQGGRDGFDRLEPRSDGPAIPPGKEPLHRGGLAKGPQRAQGLFDRPGATDLQIQRLQRGESGSMSVGPPLIAEQPHVLGPGERRVLAVAQEGAMLLTCARYRRPSSYPA